MKSFTFVTLALLGLAMFADAQSEQCMDTYNLYECLAAPGGELDIVDSWGPRKIKCEIVELNKCDDWTVNPTGLQTTTTGGSPSGLTTLSLWGIASYGQQNNGSNGDCRINNSTSGGKTSHWWPIRAIKVTALGWKIQPEHIRVSDVDMEGGTTVDGSLRKAALVWGFDGQTTINATWDISGGQLIEHDMKIEGKYLNQMGFLANYPTVYQGNSNTNLHEWFKGVMTTYADRVPQVSSPLTCAQGADDPQCAAVASFSQPIEGFFVMVNYEWKSLAQAGSLISIGPLGLKCGCKCDQRSGTRTITVPTNVAGQCTQRTSSGTMSVCNPDGANWW